MKIKGERYQSQTCQRCIVYLQSSNYKFESAQLKIVLMEDVYVVPMRSRFCEQNVMHEERKRDTSSAQNSSPKKGN